METESYERDLTKQKIKILMKGNDKKIRIKKRENVFIE